LMRSNTTPSAGRSRRTRSVMARDEGGGMRDEERRALNGERGVRSNARS
jgi:hypothetical protein